MGRGTPKRIHDHVLISGEVMETRAADVLTPTLDASINHRLCSAGPGLRQSLFLAELWIQLESQELLPSFPLALINLS